MKTSDLAEWHEFHRNRVKADLENGLFQNTYGSHTVYQAYAAVSGREYKLVNPWGCGWKTKK